MTHFYAQIDGNRIVFSLAQLSGTVDASDMIEIQLHDESLIGMVHDLARGTFIPAPLVDPIAPQRYISIGAFFDRFGPAKWSILADENAGVQAVVKDASVRKHIDLDNPDLPMGLSIVSSAGHSIDATEIIGADITDEERP